MLIQQIKEGCGTYPTDITLQMINNKTSYPTDNNERLLFYQMKKEGYVVEQEQQLLCI